MQEMLKGKKVIILGDKGGIKDAAIEACLEGTGADVIHSMTECFACMLVPTLEPKEQQKILELAAANGKENIIVVLGSSEAEQAAVRAETVTAGDPTEAGPLTGIALGLPVYHIFELKEEIQPAVYKEQCGTFEMLLEVEDIIGEVEAVRNEFLRNE
jgi:glycine reductase